MALPEAISCIEPFVAENLGKSISSIEARLKGVHASKLEEANVANAGRLFTAANVIKNAVSQINNIVHASGILAALPKILGPDEVVEFVSLAAGTGGRPFDLATNVRLAEFKFYFWRGADSARLMHGLVAFIHLAETRDRRRVRELYFARADPFIRFMAGKTKLATMLKKRFPHLLEQLNNINPHWVTVGDYYAARRRRVAVKDITALLAIS